MYVVLWRKKGSRTWFVLSPALMDKDKADERAKEIHGWPGGPFKVLVRWVDPVED